MVRAGQHPGVCLELVKGELRLVVIGLLVKKEEEKRRRRKKQEHAKSQPRNTPDADDLILYDETDRLFRQTNAYLRGYFDADDLILYDETDRLFLQTNAYLRGYLRSV